MSSRFWDWFTRLSGSPCRCSIDGQQLDCKKHSPNFHTDFPPQWDRDFVKEQTVGEPPEDTILDEAKRAVYGDREASYGHPKVDFERTATLWRAYFQARGQGVVNISAGDVARLMILLKLSRLLHGYHRDSAVDLAGYATTLDRVES